MALFLSPSALTPTPAPSLSVFLLPQQRERPVYPFLVTVIIIIVVLASMMIFGVIPVAVPSRGIPFDASTSSWSSSRGGSPFCGISIPSCRSGLLGVQASTFLCLG